MPLQGVTAGLANVVLRIGVAGIEGVPRALAAERLPIVSVDLNWTKGDLIRAFQRDVEGGPALPGEQLLARDEDGTELLVAVADASPTLLELRVLPQEIHIPVRPERGVAAFRPSDQGSYAVPRQPSVAPLVGAYA